MPSPLKKPRRAVATARRAPRRPTAARRSAHVEQEIEATPEPLTSPEDAQSFFQQGILLPHHKRQLILAHAEARKARHMPNRWIYLMGLAASCLVVMAGWWMTVGTWIQGQLAYANQPGIQEDVRDGITHLESMYPIAKPRITDAKELFQPTAASATTSPVDNSPSR